MPNLGSGGLLEAELWIFENWSFFPKMAIFQNFDDFLQPNYATQRQIGLDPNSPR